MAISTYSELQTAVANWLDRDDLGDRIPEFIALAEARMNRALRIAIMINIDETTLGGATTLVAGTRDYSLPAGYLQMIDFHLRTDPITPLSYITPENMNRMWAGSQHGTPESYTIFSDNASGKPIKQVRLGPAPASEPFLMNDQRVQLWATALQEAVGEIQSQDNKDRHSGSAMRVMNTGGYY